MEVSEAFLKKTLQATYNILFLKLRKWFLLPLLMVIPVILLHLMVVPVALRPLTVVLVALLLTVVPAVLRPLTVVPSALSNVMCS